MSLIGLVILLTAAVSIIYAVVTGEGDEGFLKGADGKAIKWTKADIPVTCFYDQDPNNIHDAVDEINKAAGFGLYSTCAPWMISKPFPDKPARGVVLLKVGVPPSAEKDGVTVSSPFDPIHGGSTLLFTDRETGDLYGAIVYVNPDAPKELMTKIWIHELGHALGLDHDRTRDSIMYPVAQERASKLSSKDIKLLREAYGK